MKKVLVTGACGFVGSHLVEYLYDKGYVVRATDLKSSNKQYIQSLIDDQKIEFMPSDLRDRKSLKKVVEGIEIIFHPAAIFNVCMDKKTLWEVNVMGTKYLCEQAVKAGVKRFINWSSSSIYGCWTGDPIAKNENVSLNPETMLNEYSRSKYYQALGVWEFKDQIDITTIIPANIYGPRTGNGLANPLKHLRFGLLPKPPAKRGMTGYISNVHVEDIVRAVEFLANKPESIGETYNISEDDPMSIKELFSLGWGLMGKKPKKGYMSPWRLQLTAKLLQGVAGIRNFLFLNLLRLSKYKWYSTFDSKAVNYMISHHMVDNQKIRNLGFEFKHKIRDSIPDLVAHHEKTEWKEIPWLFLDYKVK